MVYQAFRSHYPHSVPVSSRAEVAFIMDSPSWRVPAAPVRSLSFNNSTTI